MDKKELQDFYDKIEPLRDALDKEIETSTKGKNDKIKEAAYKDSQRTAMTIGGTIKYNAEYSKLFFSEMAPGEKQTRVLIEVEEATIDSILILDSFLGKLKKKINEAE